ncbi:BamA/TamA family outer membrane protein [Haloferula chungangensis]|uniref:BamA/TamA family outer membrane protein n=1 Tax=Haloferula chungangensis TaxID=1048331 RepID=A0ABW2LCA3_9BACT
MRKAINASSVTHRIVGTWLICCSMGAAGERLEEPVSSEADTEMRFFDREDGWLDLSEFLDHPMGFIPLLIPITEPAIGGGAAAVPVFIDKPDDGGRPSITGAGVMRTSNGSEGVFGGYSGYFLDQRLHVTAAGADMSVNLDFYGIGSGLRPNGQPFRYNLDSTFGLLGGEWKLGESYWSLGLRYAYAEIGASLENPQLPPIGVLESGIDYMVSSLRPSLLYDSRDNVFTPTKGLVSELSVTANLEALGGDTNNQSVKWSNFWYRPLVEDTLFFGIKGEVEQSFGDMPFYMRPYVKLRGAPAVRYQGDGVASFEGELRWQFHPRWSLVGFGGVGFSWYDDHPWKGSDATATGGAGIRYLIARQYGLHMGLDVAYGEEGPAVYVQFGSAWSRF